MTSGDAPKYITPTGLRGKRYWTDGMIRDLLGEPDKTAPNPHYRNRPPMRLYLLSRVDAIDAVLDTDALREARKRRSAAACRAAATRRKNTPKRAASCDLECDFGGPLEDVREAATITNGESPEYHQAEYDGYAGRSRRRGPRHPGVPAEDRRAVNYLRHECTAYDRLLDEMGTAVRPILRRRIHVEIARAYPELRAAAMSMVG